MITRTTGVLLALLLASSPLAAQRSFTDGSDPSASVELRGLGDLAPIYLGQTFVARAPTLSKVSFWYTQGTRRETVGNNWVNWFFINSGTTKGENDFLYERTLRSGSGRRDMSFGTPLQLVVGETYIFGVSTTDTECYFGPCNPRGAPIDNDSPTNQSFLDVTVGDSFADGNLVYYGSGYEGDAVPDQDMRFVLTYGVPEPSSLALLLPPLLLIGLVAVRRRSRLSRNE